MFSKGADVDALRDSAGRMASFGREVDVVRARGQRAVSAMQRVWQGPDLQQLVERWRRVEHDLTRISSELDRLSRRLHDNADLQHRSSGTSAGSGGWHHVGGGGAPAGGGPGGGRPLVTPGVPQPLHGVGGSHWIGTVDGAGAAVAPLDATYGPLLPAGVPAAAAHGLGLPIH
ncbi:MULTISPECIES: WXG100 family type VII secretion target [unclassified Terrabacter]|uniref:WXG100 family type VII secretion target n=1 Tax=unclassified Terrabacter TaxID=2630222 RepID=UPI0006F84505|nr:MULTISPECIES: hypothetical protein [unclassified Terrabacter]KRB43273.1 hypothetical protein ASD90_20390 [Terrabacter sp. Root181]KRF46232.1 hypothetical protein ASG96_21690 [Terrabacter sp. Soil810]